MHLFWVKHRLKWREGSTLSLFWVEQLACIEHPVIELWKKICVYWVLLSWEHPGFTMMVTDQSRDHQAEAEL